MTLRSWKEEFYQKPSTKKMTKIQAIEHSLLKWIGLRDKNLNKHDMYVYDKNVILEIYGLGSLQIDADSCALCIKYYEDSHSEDNNCRRCPLYKTLGHPCNAEKGRPFTHWIDTGDPEPMIKALRKTLRKAKQTETNS